LGGLILGWLRGMANLAATAQPIGGAFFGGWEAVLK
jgi:hypothetical protein